ICIRGATDTALGTLDPGTLAARDASDDAQLAKFLETRSKLGDLVLERIRRLPERHRIPLTDGREVLMVHGSPADPLTELSHDLDEEELLALVADDPADVVVCGASHVPFVRNAGDVLIVNVGSVGDAPEGRVAHYTLLAPAVEAPILDQRWVEY
ncbi:MAG: metallophosphoesterase family protein, partial [Myxococcales bacterium]|nr:metallophosphoesterase family protein [Myxococcales bacterium]